MFILWYVIRVVVKYGWDAIHVQRIFVWFKKLKNFYDSNYDFKKKLKKNIIIIK
jgi:hypothetical protein